MKRMAGKLELDGESDAIRLLSVDSIFAGNTWFDARKYEQMPAPVSFRKTAPPKSNSLGRLAL